VRALLARPAGRPDLALGALVGLALGGPLVLGEVAGDLAAGSVAALGALNTALAAATGSAGRRIITAALAAPLNALLLGLGALVADPAWLAALTVLIAVPVLVVPGMWSGIAAAAGLPATLTLIAGIGLPPGPAGERMLDGLAGGGWAVVLVALAVLPGLLVPVPATPPLPRAVAVNHAVRLALAAAAAVFVAQALDLAHGYWLAVAVAVVLRPGLAGTAERVTQRLAGTVLGGVLAAVIVRQVDSDWVLIVLAVLLVGGATALLVADYRVASALLTAGVLAMLAIGHGTTIDAVDDRLLATLAGGLLALVAILLWPEPPEPPESPEPPGRPGPAPA
jgi:uncharacterized membrane protein YgaE (UPF0421/DUF939 family)